MKRGTIVTILIVLAVMIGSRVLVPLPALPEISVAPEVLGRPFGELLPFTNSLLLTIIVDLVLVGLAIAATRRMSLVPRGLQNAMELIIDMIYNLGASIDRRNIRRIFPLIATIFFFVAFSNFLALLPGVGSLGVCRSHEAAQLAHADEPDAASMTGEEHAEEVKHGDAANGTCSTHTDEAGVEEADVLVPLFRAPTADMNTPLAIALITFFVIEGLGFKDLGVGYLGKFFPYRDGPIAVFVGILELISEFVRVLAFTFRLFGNIFAGEVVLVVMAFLAPLLLPVPFYGLELFVAFMQAFIFAILAVIFISQATTAHHTDEGHVETADVASTAGVAH